MTVLDLAKRWAEPSRILVVGDDASAAKALYSALSRFNCDVYAVPNLDEAVAAVCAATYSLIFVDFGLPNSVDIVRAIRAEQPDTPVLAMVSSDSLNEVLRCGPITLLRKQFDLTPQHLKNALAMFKVRAVGLASNRAIATA